MLFRCCFVSVKWQKGYLMMMMIIICWMSRVRPLRAEHMFPVFQIFCSRSQETYVYVQRKERGKNVRPASVRYFTSQKPFFFLSFAVLLPLYVYTTKRQTLYLTDAWTYVRYYKKLYIIIKKIYLLYEYTYIFLLQSSSVSFLSLHFSYSCNIFYYCVLFLLFFLFFSFSFFGLINSSYKWNHFTSLLCFFSFQFIHRRKK